MQERAAFIRQQIHNCPFIQLIHCGTLPQNIFDFYAEQDELYIVDLAFVLQNIANKLSTRPETRDDSVLIYARARLLLQEISDGFFNPKRTPGLFQPANLCTVKIEVVEQYTQHLKRAAKSPSITIGLAAVIPCYMMYREIGERVDMSLISPTHRYRSWIEANSNASFVSFGYQLLEIAQKVSELELADGTLESLDPVMATSEQSYAYERDLFNASFNGRPLLEASMQLGKVS
ncbi:MAG: hypothetical protein Q8R79_03740 [Legionellaceae bacterium]|nr:hypothetical protein [Legionellaceae bacterium]